MIAADGLPDLRDDEHEIVSDLRPKHQPVFPPRRAIVRHHGTLPNSVYSLANTYVLARQSTKNWGVEIIVRYHASDYFAAEFVAGPWR